MSPNLVAIGAGSWLQNLWKDPNGWARLSYSSSKLRRATDSCDCKASNFGREADIFRPKVPAVLHSTP